MVITSAIIRGGAGKSTTSAALLQAAATDHKRALAIDLDPQANLTYYLNAEQTRQGSFDFLHGAEADEVVQSVNGIEIMAGCNDLATETTRSGSAKRLSKALRPIRSQYDLVVVDTPPQIGELTYNALYAADGVLVPLESDISGLQGLYQIADIIAALKEGGAEATITGVIVTRFDGRPKLNRHLLSSIQEACDEMEIPFLSTIHQTVSIKEAQALQKSLFEYAPKSSAAEDYRELYERIMRDE